MPLSQLYFVISAFLLALGSVLVKLLLSMDSGGAEIDPLPFLTLQKLGGVAFLLAAQLTQSGTWEPWRRLRRPALAGLVLGVGSVGTIMALALISASETSVVFATQPIVILVLAWAFLHERVGIMTVALSLLAVLGVMIIIFAGGVAASDMRSYGLGFAFLSTVSAAIYVIWMRGASGQVRVLNALIVVLSVAFVVAAALWGALDILGFADLRLGNAYLALAAFGAGALYYGAAFYIYLLGLRETEASEAGLYLNLVPVFVIALAWFVLGERLVPLQWLGAVLVICSISAVSWISAKQET